MTPQELEQLQREAAAGRELAEAVSDIGLPTDQLQYWFSQTQIVGVKVRNQCADIVRSQRDAALEAYKQAIKE